MGLKIVTVASHLNQGHYNRYIDQIRAAGLEGLHFYLPDFSWAARLHSYWNIARAHPDDTLIFTDAWDVLLMKGETVIEDYHPGDRILFGAEVNIWPPGTGHDRLKGARPPNLFLNAGLLMARGELLADFMDYFNLQHLSTDIDDQAMWHKVADTDYGSNFMCLDGRCELFQNLYYVEDDVEVVDGRAHNKRFDTYPLFIHGNGKTSLDRFLV